MTLDWDAVWAGRSALVLHSVGLRSQWALQIAKALTTNKSLVNINLAGQPLGSASAFDDGSAGARCEARVGAELSVALRAHWALEWICLESASLHDEALSTILSALADHP